MVERLLILGAGPFQLPAIRKGQEMGFTVVATDADPLAVGLQEADYPHTVDLIDAAGCLALAKQYRVSGVLTVASEMAVPTVAAVAQELGLPGPGTDGAAIATNKALMRDLFAKCGIPSPRVRLCDALAQAEDAAEVLGFPVVVKPTDNAASRGVKKVDRMDQVGSAFSHAMEHSREKRVLVEEYMDGAEVTVEGFVCSNSFVPLVLSDKLRTPPPYFVDHTFLYPSQQPEEVQAGASRIVKRAIEEAGLENAAIHAEVMITDTGPKMVEFAARGGGSKIFTDILPWVTGIDVVASLIKMSVGEEISLTPSHHRGAVLRWPEARPGKVLKVTGLEEARSVPGLVDMDIYVEKGDVVKPLTSGSDRLGYFITFGDSRNDAEFAMEKVEAGFRIVVANDRGHKSE